uniref:Cytochrome c oxidase subunit 2 n=1 Tax=Diadromus collaris TaxID=7421 RepID=U5HTE1_9HYME|nr:cytochrome c oxidase subunit II [Diadromus collaris]
MSNWSMINLQDANSPIMENLYFFHDHAMLIILMITIMIFYIILTLSINKFNNKMILQNQMIEIIWTIFPMIILIFLAIPSLKILYLTDEIIKPLLTIKSIGHQWYWSYEYSDFKNIDFNSFMLLYNNSFNNNMFRLLDVDNRLILPFNNQIRILTSSIDVIHSWTIPSLGIKMDSIPGRINQSSIMINRPGIFFGQCSEICGMNHSFMPIMIESTSKMNFINWLKIN